MRRAEPERVATSRSEDGFQSMPHFSTLGGWREHTRLSRRRVHACWHTCSALASAVAATAGTGAAGCSAARMTASASVALCACSSMKAPGVVPSPTPAAVSVARSRVGGDTQRACHARGRSAPTWRGGNVERHIAVVDSLELPKHDSKLPCSKLSGKHRQVAHACPTNLFCDHVIGALNLARQWHRCILVGDGFYRSEGGHPRLRVMVVGGIESCCYDTRTPARPRRARLASGGCACRGAHMLTESRPRPARDDAPSSSDPAPCVSAVAAYLAILSGHPSPLQPALYPCRRAPNCPHDGCRRSGRTKGAKRSNHIANASVCV